MSRGPRSSPGAPGKPNGEAQARRRDVRPACEQGGVTIRSMPTTRLSLLRPVRATRLTHRPLRVTSRSCLGRRKTARPGIIPRRSTDPRSGEALGVAGMLSRSSVALPQEVPPCMTAPRVRLESEYRV